MRQKMQILAFMIFLFSIKVCMAQSFYDFGTIQKIELSFTQPDWKHRMDTAKAGADGYLMAEWVKFNGTRFDSVGVKFKGSSSYDSTYKKNPYHIALDKFKNQSFQNLTDIKLGNSYADPSMIRETMSYNILQNYMECPRSNFAQLYINGEYIGLYSNEEDITKKFCAARFNSSKKNTFIKCNPIGNASITTKSNLKYISADSSAYMKYYEMKSDFGWQDLVNLCNTISNHPENLSQIMNVDRVLWMLAFNNVFVNLDSYSGAFSQNYFVFRDNTGLFNPIVWDLNMSFGGFPFLGNSNSSMGSLSIKQMGELPISIHSTDQYWPLINAVMKDPMYKKMYVAHIRTIANENFANGKYQTLADSMRVIIDVAVKSDTNKFYSYSQFQTGMTADVSIGTYLVPGISNLMTARVTYLQTTQEFLSETPIISDIKTVILSKDTATVTAKITQTTGLNSIVVYLGYRLKSTDNFVRISMFDDGNHGDGAANDGIFGASANMIPDQSQFYIYAENDNVGIFSPERAEHEFYILNSANGVQEANLSNETKPLSIYPNPANTEFHISSNGILFGNFKIVNALGEIIYRGEIADGLSINIENWAQGLYFLHCGGISEKIIIFR